MLFGRRHLEIKVKLGVVISQARMMVRRQGQSQSRMIIRVDFPWQEDNQGRTGSGHITTCLESPTIRMQRSK